MKKISLLLLIVSLCACKSNNKLCTCIEAGNEINVMSAKMTPKVADAIANIKHNYFLIYRSKNDSTAKQLSVDSLKQIISQDSVFVFKKKDSIRIAKERRDKVCKKFEKLSDKEIQASAMNCPSLKYDVLKK